MFEGSFLTSAGSHRRPRGGGQAVARGDGGAAEWTLVWSEKSGEERRLRGCDLFDLGGDLIRTKNSFVKTTSR